MENNQSNYPRPKVSQPTFLGTLIFTLFNLILLSILAWVVLEIGFCASIIVGHSANISVDIHSIVNTYQRLINQYPNTYIDTALWAYQQVKSSVYLYLGENISVKTAEMMLGITELILMRFCLFIQFIPFILAILCVSVIDGLVLRDKRKFQGARESTLLFHRLKPLAKLSFFTLFFIYMANPYSLSPLLLLMPMAVLSSLFTMLSIRCFKKYL